MYQLTLASAALLGLATALPYNAPPNEQWEKPSSSSSGWTSTSASSYQSTSTSNGEQPFKFPLPNGFPNISNPSAELDAIQQWAQGTLPKAAANAPPPPTPKQDSVISLGFVAFNELFEVAFFTELIANITNEVPGYTDINRKSDVLHHLRVILAQEELHELNANGAFQKFTGKSIEPCKYVFPVDSFNDALELASTFTDVVLGTLPDIQTIFANDNDNGLIRGVGSVIGQEGEQNGFYRDFLGKVPSALPFLTASARDFAFSAINQNFVVPGSCPSLNLLEPTLKIFDILEVLTPPTEPVNQQVKFAFKTSQSDVPAPKTNTLTAQQNFLTYINQQNAPVSVAIENQKIAADGSITFTAEFPGADNEMNGLTIAAITVGSDFVDVDAVAKATIFGPGLIEIN